jgi:hypothetical protein
VLPEALAAFGVTERVSRNELEGGPPAKRSGRGPSGRPDGRDRNRERGNPPGGGGGRHNRKQGGRPAGASAAPPATAAAARHAHPLAAGASAAPAFRAIKNAGRGRGRR